MLRQLARMDAFCQTRVGPRYEANQDHPRRARSFQPISGNGNSGPQSSVTVDLKTEGHTTMSADSTSSRPVRSRNSVWSPARSHLSHCRGQPHFACIEAKQGFLRLVEFHKRIVSLDA